MVIEKIWTKVCENGYFVSVHYVDKEARQRGESCADVKEFIAADIYELANLIKQIVIENAGNQND